MNDLLKIIFASAAFAMLLSSGLVANSSDKRCPGTPVQQGTINQYEFLKAHGLTQDSFSIWLMEHSEWRRKYSDELEEFSFIPQKDFEIERQGE